MKDKKITIKLADNEFLKIAKLAHEADITFNHMCERILTEELLSYAFHSETKEKQNSNRGAKRTVISRSGPSRKIACK